MDDIDIETWNTGAESTKEGGDALLDTGPDLPAEGDEGEHRQEVEISFGPWEEVIEIREDDNTMVQYVVPTPKAASGTAHTMSIPIALKKVPSTLKKAPATLRKALAAITPPQTPNGSQNGQTTKASSNASSSASSIQLHCTSARKQRQAMEKRKIERMIQSGQLIVVKNENKPNNRRKASPANSEDETGICVLHEDGTEGKENENDDQRRSSALKEEVSDAELVDAAQTEESAKATRAKLLLRVLSTKRVRSNPQSQRQQDGAIDTFQSEEDGDGDAPVKMKRSTSLIRVLSRRQLSSLDDNDEDQIDADAPLARTESFLNLISGQGLEPEVEEPQKKRWSKKVKIRKRRKSSVEDDKDDEGIWGTIVTTSDNFWTGVKESETLETLKDGMVDVFSDPKGMIDDVMEEWAIFWDE